MSKIKNWAINKAVKLIRPDPRPHRRCLHRRTRPVGRRHRRRSWQHHRRTQLRPFRFELETIAKGWATTVTHPFDASPPGGHRNFNQKAASSGPRNPASSTATKARAR
jgi:hypothetical protein